jgi:predicted porin
MKKHLIGAAVAASLAVPAMAQNVSVYGVLESGVASIKGGAGVMTYTGTVDSIVATSALGFRGTEDLGGGMKAGFRLETRLDPTSGDVDKKRENSFFERGAEVFLEGPFGKVQIGKLDHQGGENNDQSKFGNVGLIASAVEVGSDADHTVSFTTPAFNGFTINVGHSFGDSTSGVNTQATAGASGLTSEATVAAVGDISSWQISGAVSGVTLKLGSATSKAVLGAKTKVTGASIGYKFGNIDASIARQTEDVPNSAVDESFTVLNASMPLSGALTAHLVYGKFDTKTTTAADYNLTAVGITYALSKRTNAYAIHRVFDYGTGGVSNLRQSMILLGHSF